MANLTIKAPAGSGNKLILQDQAGGTVITTADSGGSMPAVVMTPTGTAPAATAGQMYFDTTQNKIYIHNGTSWGVIDVHSAKATGGNIFQYQLGSTTYQSHTFYANGTFVAHEAITIDILVVAGGGSGSSGHYSGGAGAGGMVSRAIYSGNTVWGLIATHDVTKFQEECNTTVCGPQNFTRTRQRTLNNHPYEIDGNSEEMERFEECPLNECLGNLI